MLYLLKNARAVVNPINRSPPKCRDCVFFEGNPVYVHNMIISEGRCLKTARSSWKIENKVPVKVTRYDLVETTRRHGICGPDGLFFYDKKELNITKS